MLVLFDNGFTEYMPVTAVTVDFVKNCNEVLAYELWAEEIDIFDTIEKDL